MKIEAELAGLSPQKDMLLTVGVFDGVHLGHKYLLAQLVAEARRQDMLSGVVTFRQHPREVLSPGTRLAYLTNLAQRVRLLKAEGIDAVVALSFDREAAQLNARQFVELLLKHLRMRGLVIGPDFALGRAREGNAEALRALGEEMRFSVTVISPHMVDGQVISSTTVRQALAGGDVGEVHKLLGRAFSIEGKVTTGTGRGAKLGFPTINLDVEPGQALPADGVYATRVDINGEVYQAVTNIGLRPTFDGQGRTVETHILNFQGDLYGRDLKVDIIERLRGEKKFANAEALRQQITEDVKRGAALLKSGDRS